MAEERESFESQWAPSDVTEENLKEMVAHDVLPAKEIIGWRPAHDEAFPTPDTHGVSWPHFALFRRIFFLKLQPNKSKPCVVGGAGFQLRGTLSQKYFFMPFKTSNKGWHANWFYVQNPEPALPEYSCLPPVYQDTWNSLPMGEEAAQALVLMDRMLKLKEQGLQGEQITRHFIKSRLALIKERSRTAFEFDGKHDPNCEDPDSLDFKVMKERMYKIFSNTIVVSYSHLLPVVPYNAFNPPPPEFALIKSDPPIAQRRSPRRQTGQASGGPKIWSDTQPNTSKSASQSDSRKRKLVLSDDEGDDARKSGNKEVTGKQPRQTNPKKKTSSCPMPKIRKSSSRLTDPSGKDSEPTDMETGPSKETGPTAEDRSSDKQPATDNVEPSNEPPTGNQSAEAGVGANQEPPTGNQSGTEPNEDIPEVEAQADGPPKKDVSADPGSSSPVKIQGPARPRPEIITGPMIGDEEEVLRIQSAEDSHPPILVKWWDDDMQPQGIVINKQKEDEEVCLLKKALSQATRIVNRIHLRNEAKTATLERLVPHLGTLEATRNQLHEAKELARKTEHDLRDRIAELQDSNFELSGSSKVQAAKISELEKRVQALENDKAELARQRDSALKDVEGARDEVANAATPLVQAMFFNNNGPSTFDASEIFDKLRVAPDTYFKNIKEVGSMGASLALAMTKSLYPKIDIDAIDGFADGMSEETALDLINDAQKAADKIAVDVVERFQDNDLWPTGSDNCDDEKTDTD
uniref:OSJNBb0070J16.9 protein n=1 Tax=Oryza sativa subsp. japonica TaxID=39947 RepID=Q7X844_ORYSJ|nr:OSJNBb0070J16.9 [Oryza sativa Japonica Group]CAE02344.1 OSJNBb0072M01.5 [Oryza sativa Japonica Group]